LKGGDFTMKGKSDIPELKLEVLQKFITKFTAPPNLILMNMFPEMDSPSSSIKWESQEGQRGMTPFVAPGAPAPQTAPIGLASHEAEAAYWKEKMYFDEEFLNNLRKEGTESQYLGAKQRLARETRSLVYRAMRRKEWMFSKMLFSGTMTYAVASGTKISVDYNIPDTHKVTLTTNYRWPAGSTKDIIGDIIDGKTLISDDCGGMVDICVCNTTTLKYIARDSALLALLHKSAFGEGDLFKGKKNNLIGVNPNVLAGLLDIKNLIIYDEKYEVRSYLVSGVTGSSTTAIVMEDVSDFEVGDTLRFVDVSAGTYEDETISAVAVETNTATVASAPTASFKAGEDYCFVRKNYIPTGKFVMMATSVEGQPIAEFMRAPFALNRHYGMKIDSNDVWDPEGTYIRVQDKGLPVLYQRDAIYILDVDG
jgi:hypothetical protein